MTILGALCRLAFYNRGIFKSLEEYFLSLNGIWSNGVLDLSKLEHKTYWIIFFLQSLCNSEDLVTQLTFLQNLDEEKRDLLQGTILRHEMLIAYLHLYHKLEFHCEIDSRNCKITFLMTD